MQSLSRFKVCRAAALFLLFNVSVTVFPLEQLSLNLGTISGQDWSAEQISLRIDLAAEDNAGDAFHLSIGRIRHPHLESPLIGTTLKCSVGRVTGQELKCDNGSVLLNHSALDSQRFKITLYWKYDRQLIEIKSKKINFLGGKATASLKLDDRSWEATLRATSLDSALFQALINEIADLSNQQLSIAGGLDLDLNLSGQSDGRVVGSWQISSSDLSFSALSDTYLGEGISAVWGGKIRLQNDRWRGSQRMKLSQGAILTPFIYLAAETAPITLESDFQLPQGLESLSFDRLSYHHPGVAGFSASGRFDLSKTPQLGTLKLETEPLSLKAIHASYIQPALAEPFIEAMELSGTIAARLNINSGDDPLLSLRLDKIGLNQRDPESEGARLLELRGLSGNLTWPAEGVSHNNKLSLAGGSLFDGIILEAFELTLGLKQWGLSLQQPVSIPVLDGTLRAESFALEQTAAGPKVEFKGYMTPISMAALSRALGWMPLAGQLSGMIPSISYESGVMAIDGVTLIRIFGGAITIRDLRLDDLFGTFPVLQADVEFKELDLETLTRTFSFGKITGKLEGSVKGLRLEEWQPVSFDGRFYTPTGDKSSHRISQKAVDNISDLGGAGISGALSRSFLRFFEVFGYSRLGISCRLKNDICEMGGVEPAERGYYLVKGGGVPRIDILGFNRRTDWPLLIAKLKEITEQGTTETE